ncbi:MAG TPA: hypothetical protein VGE45_00360 [Chloroflexia bacterium]|jgi:hypothetical protein
MTQDNEPEPTPIELAVQYAGAEAVTELTRERDETLEQVFEELLERFKEADTGWTQHAGADLSGAAVFLEMELQSYRDRFKKAQGRKSN